MSCEICGKETLEDGICYDCREEAVDIGLPILKEHRAEMRKRRIEERRLKCH